MMTTPLVHKSSVDAIKARFDHDVERFSNLETGQAATIDAPLAMELITQAAVRATKPIRRVLDIGCGAGNNTLKLSQFVSPFDCDLVDLSLPMQERYGAYLFTVGGDAFRDKVFDYIDKEESPRPVTYQLALLRKVGFRHMELLHKNSCFAAFGAIKALQGTP